MRDAAVGRAHRDMAAVAGDEQIGRRRGQRPDRADRERHQAPAAPARPPQATTARRRSSARRRRAAWPAASRPRRAPSPTVWASHSRSASAWPVSHQNGAPSPTISSSSASASSGMITKVVSGIATILAKRAVQPGRWKWNRGDRRQRHLDHEAGQQQAGELAPEPREPALVARARTRPRRADARAARRSR